MQGIFKDNDLEQTFQREGFVKVPFLDVQGLQKFRSHVADILQYFEASNYGICSATDLNQPELVRSVHQFVIEHITPYLRQYFRDYQAILGNYLIKKAQENTLIPIHQDWTFVDEKRFYSLSIWCPLEDVDERNGNLQVIPRTHRMTENLRPSPSYPNAFEQVAGLARERLINIPMEAGEAIFYDHALLHASPVNQSNRERSALIFGMTHRDAELVHYYMEKWPDAQSNTAIMESFPMSEDFFVFHKRGERPSHVLPKARFLTCLNQVSADVFRETLQIARYA